MAGWPGFEGPRHRNPGQRNRCLVSLFPSSTQKIGVFPNFVVTPRLLPEKAEYRQLAALLPNEPKHAAAPIPNWNGRQYNSAYSIPERNFISFQTELVNKRPVQSTEPVSLLADDQILKLTIFPAFSLDQAI